MSSINTKLSFVELGKFLSQFKLNEQVLRADVLHNDLYFEKFKDLIELSQSHNGWFTPEQVYFSVQSWAEALTEEN
ncbi:MAG TPA: acyl-CoA reductase, partial [Flavobacterium sp.]|nr:acyl-CoA reductase [Flavobacterium sp.]